MVPIRVLLADGDEWLLASYRTFLFGNGFEVATATNGLECLTQLRDFIPDILVLDPEMLWGQGDGILALMQENADVPQVPVILLAAHDGPEGRALRAAYPRCVYHVKPLAPERLEATIRGMMDGSAAPGRFAG
jgi:DNA-binding response OmpR family regulator